MLGSLALTGKDARAGAEQPVREYWTPVLWRVVARPIGVPRSRGHSPEAVLDADAEFAVAPAEQIELVLEEVLPACAKQVGQGSSWPRSLSRRTSLVALTCGTKDGLAPAGAAPSCASGEGAAAPAAPSGAVGASQGDCCLASSVISRTRIDVPRAMGSSIAALTGCYMRQATWRA